MQMLNPFMGTLKAFAATCIIGMATSFGLFTKIMVIFEAVYATMANSTR
jgi:hypothetical protein